MNMSQHEREEIINRLIEPVIAPLRERIEKLEAERKQPLSKHNEFNPETEYPGSYGALSRPHRGGDA